METTHRQSIIAIFATAAEADTALRELTAAGVPPEALRRYETETETADVTSGGQPATATTTESHGGFWAWLLGEETGPTYASTGNDPYRDRPLVEREVARGRAVLAVRARTDAQAEQALTILDRHHPLSLEEQGSVPAGAEATASTRLSERDVTGDVVAHPGTGESTIAAPTSLAPAAGAMPIADTQPAGEATRATGDETTIPLVSETVRIDTRPIERAGLRIRRYVVERPVEREVTLRDEQVSVERRAPTTTEPARDVAEDAFRERTIEVAAVREEPVIEKAVRVIEEVVVHRQAHERTETVHATERHEEVEITDTTGDAGRKLTDAEIVERDGQGHAD